VSQLPAALISYVRFDDKHENGRLSELCQRLSGEVQAQTGEKFFHLPRFEDIAWGQQWQERIFESLDAVTFLIPILTPSFFKSEACRSELEDFIEREKRFKRNDLILPIYYIGVRPLARLRNWKPIGWQKSLQLVSTLTGGSCALSPSRTRGWAKRLPKTVKNLAAIRIGSGTFRSLVLTRVIEPETVQLFIDFLPRLFERAEVEGRIAAVDRVPNRPVIFIDKRADSRASVFVVKIFDRCDFFWCLW
jgi:hypothetical protein